MTVREYIRKRFFPHIWCSGCGHGIVMGSLIRAIHNLGIQKNDVVVISGIGCSARICGYLDFHTLHSLHGRAIAFATSIKFSKPKLNVIVPMGDGDALAIGGNHLIHAARRNIDLTTIIMNNNIYGMTGGQFSPTTEYGTFASTAPYGNIDRPFDVVKLALFKIGLAFQIADDILDLSATSEELGKTAGKDSKQEKITYPAIVGIEKSKAIAAEVTDGAIAQLSDFGPEADMLRRLAKQLLERTK